MASCLIVLVNKGPPETSYVRDYSVSDFVWTSKYYSKQTLEVQTKSHVRYALSYKEKDFSPVTL